jgi:tRNA(Ile2) C34 agmatinyltransferase TiaS
MVFLTQKRKFRCRDCKRVFRAPDRRFQPRELNDVYDAAFTVEILR